MDAKTEIIIPTGFFCGGNCASCRYWNHSEKPDNNGRKKCFHYGVYYNPSERQGCLSYERN